MNRQPLRLPKYRNHKYDCRAVVTLNGREIYLGKYGTEESQRRYKQLIAKWLASDKKLPEQKSATPTIAELCLAYFKHAQQYYRTSEGDPTGADQAIKLALRQTRKLYGPIKVTEFGPLALQAVRQMWIGEGLSRSTVNAYTYIVKRMFRWGVSKEMMPEAVHRALLTVTGLAKGRSEAKETEPKRPVPEAHITAVKPHIAQPRLCDAWLYDHLRLPRLVPLSTAFCCALGKAS